MPQSGTKNLATGEQKEYIYCSLEKREADNSQRLRLLTGLLGIYFMVDQQRRDFSLLHTIVHPSCTAPAASSYPSIENSFNGCQGHPPLCLPPRTAQRIPDRIQKMLGRAAIYSANSSRWHKCKSGWSLKTEKIHLKWHVYIDTTHTIRHLFLTWTSLYPFTFPKTQLKHMRQSACFSFNFWLAMLSELYLCTHLPWSNINEIKLNQNTDHISAFTRPIISSCLHTTYVNLMISVVSTQICHPSNQASIK